MPVREGRAKVFGIDVLDSLVLGGGEHAGEVRACHDVVGNTVSIGVETAFESVGSEHDKLDICGFDGGRWAISFLDDTVSGCRFKSLH